ncbi:MAG: tRNA lysidine(34) synthetase TilS [Clostridia bacterium]|nr:tRNA lysidine(34) synthetase TilS [Clostridia bacterium]
MALLHYLSEHSEGFSLLAVHCEHGIRGEEALKDASFVESYCRERGIAFRLFREDCPARARNEKISLESAARLFRYESFASVLSEGLADVVLTAHHEKDNAETVLFRLARGSSLSGLAGICEREGIARPMLHVTRFEVDDYIARNGIPYREDGTNTDERYTRNFIRREILPLLEEKIPGSTSNIARFARLAKEDDELLCSMAEELIEGNSVRLDHRFPLFSRACLSVMKALGLDSDYTSTHLTAVYSLIDKENGKKITLPNGIEAYREYDRVTFYRSVSAAAETPFRFGTIPFGKGQVVVGEGNLFFDADRIPETAVVRTRRDADRFRPYKGHEKSLGDWMTDKKIPLSTRNCIPVVADGNKILIVVGYEISDEVKLTAGTKRSCRIEYR